MISKNGQVTIFVILGVMIVATILFIFFIDRRPSISRGQDFDNPESYIDNCVKDRAENLLDEMLPLGGFIDSQDTVRYDDKEVTYLCKNIRYYEPCINQYPRYIFTLEREIEAQLADDISQCFSALEQQLIRKNYAVDGGDLSIQISLKDEIVNLRVLRDFSVSKEGFTRDYDSFDVYLAHPVYRLAYVANEIVAQEARFCYFNNDGFMAIYPEFDIRKDLTGDSTKIYTITHKESGKQLNMAVRGCAIPAGY